MGSVVRCALQPFLNVFKSLASLERAVDHCTIHLDADHCKLILQFDYKQGMLLLGASLVGDSTEAPLTHAVGLVRSHHFGYEDCESLQAIFSKEACPNLMAGPTEYGNHDNQPCPSPSCHPHWCSHLLPTSLFREVAAHFPQSLEEVSLSVARDRLCFRTYFEDERGAPPLPHPPNGGMTMGQCVILPPPLSSLLLPSPPPSHLLSSPPLSTPLPSPPPSSLLQEWPSKASQKSA